MKKIKFLLDNVPNLSKKLFLMAVLLYGFMLLGCTTDIDDLQQTDRIDNYAAGIANKVSKADAMDIARKVLKKSPTRGGTRMLPTFEYVVEETFTRGGSCADTLAYILNYPNNEGFVIISTDRRVYPVLGFADEGHFSFDNDNARDNFIEKIGTYMYNAISDTLYDVTEHDFDGCYVVNPMVQVSLEQGAPWNKYVIEEHPACPVGCVAVATALVMSHSKVQLSYHNSVFYLKSMITAINEGQNPPVANTPKRIIGGYLPTYTYEQAVDSMARLLYWIGKDVNMNYTQNGSGAFSSDAYYLCKSLSYSIPSGYATFDIKTITQYLKDNHIIYLRGSDIDDKGGHAWVSDACYFCVDLNDQTKILDTYIHCDWGWGGSCNGYYSGSVFEVSSYKFRPSDYFAVKREWN